MTAEMFKAWESEGTEWLYVILNDFMTHERLLQDLKESEILGIFKQKGDVLECGSYRGIKLLEIGLTLLTLMAAIAARTYSIMTQMAAIAATRFCRYF